MLSVASLIFIEYSIQVFKRIKNLCLKCKEKTAEILKLRLAGTAGRFERRTSNIERRILLTLHFIDLKTSEPQAEKSR